MDSSGRKGRCINAPFRKQLTMREKINKEVSVIMYYNARDKQPTPPLIYWQNKYYVLGPVDYYHNYMEGQERQHIYELCDKEVSLFFRLLLDSKNLHWTLESVHDGLPN